MKNQNSHNSHNTFIRPRRLIFFQKSQGTENDGVKKLMELTEADKKRHEQLSKTKNTPHGRKLAELFADGNGKLDRDVYEKVSHLVINDTNAMSKKPIQEFVEALAKGKFPNRGENALVFLDALMSGNPAKRKKARKFIHNILKEDKSKRSVEDMELELLEELSKMPDEAEGDDETLDIMEETSSLAANTAKRAETMAQVERITASPVHRHWTPELPKEEGKALDAFDKELMRLRQDYVRTDDQIKALLKTKDKGKDAQLAQLNKKFAEINAGYAKVLAESKPVQDSYDAAINRILAREEALNNFAMESGITINEVEELLVDAEKGPGKIRITGIDFDKNRSDMTPESPGALLVDYIDEGGHAHKGTVFKVFLNYLRGTNAREDIKTPEELNKKIERNTEFKNVEAGQTYTKTIIKLDKNNRKVYGTESFKIKEVNEENGMITLDRAVVVMPQNLLPDSTSREKYGDRIKQELSFGEFAAFIRRQGYIRESHESEDQTIIDAFAQSRIDKCWSYMDGASKERKELFDALSGAPKFANETITLPSEGNKQKVEYFENGRKKWGFLELSKNKNGERQYIVTPSGDKMSGVWGLNEVPATIAYIRNAATDEEEDENIERKIMDRKSFFEQVSQGNITNAPDFEEGMEDAAEAAEKRMTKSMPGNTSQSSSDGEGASKEGEGKTTSNKYEEALPFNEVFKAGGMKKEARGFFMSIYANTRMFSIDDLWEMGKAMYEFYVRKFERKQKERYSKVGEELPYFAPEMKRINQAAETEQVNQYKEAFDQKGIFEIQGRLRNTRDQDEMKAALIVLTEKGQMRWDDIEFWKNLNRFVNPALAIPIPSNGDPRTQVSLIDERTGFSFLKDAIDSLWGEGGYNSWYSKNKSTFASNAKGYYEEGKELEGVHGGHGRRLRELLMMHKMGEFVDPHEYEGLLLHAIDAGKAFMQQKLYYMIEGVAAENAEGRTILSIDRMAHFNSEMLNQFPLLEYLCAQATRDNGESYRFTKDDYKQWAGWFDKGDPLNCSPTDEVDKFLWKYVLPSDNTQNRINKALRHGEKLDHDDMFGYLPPATEGIVTDTCKSTTGSKKFLTVEGYLNAFPGFSQYIKSLGENGNEEKLIEAFKSYVRFEGIMTNKFEKEDKGYQRMDKASLAGGSIASDTPGKTYIAELSALVKRVAAEYNDTELNGLIDLIYGPETGDITIREEKEKQNRINHAFHKFGDVFERVVRQNGLGILLNAVTTTRLTGMEYTPDEVKNKKRAAAAAKGGGSGD